MILKDIYLNILLALAAIDTAIGLSLLIKFFRLTYSEEIQISTFVLLKG